MAAADSQSAMDELGTPRYFVSDRRGLTLVELGYGVRAGHPGFQFSDLVEADQTTCHIGRMGEALARLQVVSRSDAAFAAEADVLRAVLVVGRKVRNKEALQVVDKSSHVLVAHLLAPGLGLETPGGALRPLWSWLLDHREGLLQVGDRGFFMGRVPSLEDEGTGDPTH